MEERKKEGGRETDQINYKTNIETLTNTTARIFSSYLPKHIDLVGANELFIQIECCMLNSSFSENRPLIK